jgi:ribosomal protein S12 methylthiotransferase
VRTEQSLLEDTGLAGSPTQVVGSPIQVAFITLGCAKNEVDSEKMMALIQTAGWRLTEDPAQADCLVINTCAFITEAIEEAISTILEAAELPNIASGQCKLVVCGCLPSRYGHSLSPELPEIAAFIPVLEEHSIVSTISSLFATEPTLEAANQDSLLKAAPTPRRIALRQAPWAYLKIAEGCSRHCSFCTVPTIRGPYQSTPLAELLLEAEELVSAGARELILIAQDTGLWHDGQFGLPDLLEQLASRYPDVWLRIMYMQPNGVSDQLLQTMAKHPNICNYLDIPLQHAAARVLAEMNRSGSREEFLSLLQKIREVLPDVTLRTTMIAGFPSETRQEAKLSESFLKAAQFDYVGVFIYSQEKGTPAGERFDQVPLRTRRARAQRLRDLSDCIGYQRAEARIGKVLEVLVCEMEDDQPVGRSQGQAPEVDSLVYLDSGQPGQRLTVCIEGSFCYDNDGRVC